MINTEKKLIFGLLILILLYVIVRKEYFTSVSVKENGKTTTYNFDKENLKEDRHLFWSSYTLDDEIGVELPNYFEFFEEGKNSNDGIPLISYERVDSIDGSPATSSKNTPNIILKNKYKKAIIGSIILTEEDINGKTYDEEEHIKYFNRVISILNPGIKLDKEKDYDIYQKNGGGRRLFYLYKNIIYDIEEKGDITYSGNLEDYSGEKKFETYLPVHLNLIYIKGPTEKEAYQNILKITEIKNKILRNKYEIINYYLQCKKIELESTNSDDSTSSNKKCELFDDPLKDQDVNSRLAFYLRKGELEERPEESKTDMNQERNYILGKLDPASKFNKGVDLTADSSINKMRDPNMKYTWEELLSIL